MCRMCYLVFIIYKVLISQTVFQSSFRECDGALKSRSLTVAASCTDFILGRRRAERYRFAPAPRWDTGLRQPAHPLPHVPADTSPYPLGYPHIPLGDPLLSPHKLS